MHECGSFDIDKTSSSPVESEDYYDEQYRYEYENLRELLNTEGKESLTHV